MLERVIGTAGRLLPFFIAGTMFLSQGCSTSENLSVNSSNPETVSHELTSESYKALDIDSIPQSNPVNREGRKAEYDSSDYSDMGWKEAIKKVKTPEQAQSYLDKHFDYGEFEVAKRGYFEPFNKNNKDGAGACMDYACASAALLGDNGYAPIILNLKSSQGPSHTEHIYKKDEKYYTIGTKGIDKGYSSVKELASQFNNLQDEYNFVGFYLFNLNKNHGDDWIKSLYKEETLSGTQDTNKVYRITQD